jgi:hypothetical protein
VPDGYLSPGTRCAYASGSSFVALGHKVRSSELKETSCVSSYSVAQRPLTPSVVPHARYSLASLPPRAAMGWLFVTSHLDHDEFHWDRTRCWASLKFIRILFNVGKVSAYVDTPEPHPKPLHIRA